MTRKIAQAQDYSLRLTPHASRLTPHASRLTPHAFKINEFPDPP
ncbi:MAG: succinylglutamate desuccinylase [Betaproteobacteria bacterium]|nr:succinylglutamate desuccinylase [Betaproteobacteria bacterium]